MNYFKWIKTCVSRAARLCETRGSGRRPWLTLALCAALLVWALVPLVSGLGIGQIADAAPAPQSSTSGGRITLGNIDETQLTVLRGNTVPMARKEFDRGLAPATLPMDRMLLVLKRSPEKEAALQKLMEEQQDHSSPNFHKWLTPEQFGGQFGLSDQEIQTVTTWLESQGFTINNVSKGRTLIEFSGMAATVQKSFHTGIHKYLVNGEEHWANESDPQIPSALAPLIVGVNSLNNFRRKPMHHIALTPSNASITGEVHSVNPQFSLPSNLACGANYKLGGTRLLLFDCNLLGPTDFATIYNILPLWNAGIDGTGQSIAVVGRSNIPLQDVHNFRSLFGLPANDPQIIVNGPDPGLVPGDETESLLDVEWSGAVAKGATIKFVTSQSIESTMTDGVDLSAEYIINNNVAPVMSESYGLCEFMLGSAGNQFYNTMWKQAAAQGITVLLSTGDSGSAGCDFADPSISTPQPAQFGLQVSGLSSTPFNTAVGGTDFDPSTDSSTFWSTTNDPVTHASALGYMTETSWNDACTNSIWTLANLSSTPDTNCNNLSVTPSFTIVVGGSGGASNCTISLGSLSSCSGGYAKPVWQTGPGVPADGKRDVPDVSLFAGDGLVGTAYVVCEADLTGNVPCNLNSPFNHFLLIGGTSASVQVFAGVMALVNQRTHTIQGLANPTLYLLASQQSASNCNSSSSPASTCIFYDTTKGTIAVPCDKTKSPNCIPAVPSDAFGILPGFATGAGYDLATGLGSMNVANLANAWATSANPVDFAFGTPSPTTNTVTAGNPATYTIPVNVVSTPGLVELSCSGLPAGATCNITPNNPITSGNSATVTITTTAHSTIPPVAPSIRLRPLPIYGMWVLLAALLAVAATFSIKVGVERRLVFGLSSAFLVAFLALQVGCGGGSGGGGGGGGSPSASLSPTTLGFASTVVGTTTAAQTVTLTNNGSGSLAISGITVAGTNAADFTQTNTCGATVVVGTNCTISVSFKPSIVGAESASISVSDNATGSPQTVSLSGTGASGASVSFSPTSLNFGNQTVTLTSPPQTVIMSNTGTGTLFITGIGLTGAHNGDFLVSSTCNATVSAGGNCTFSINFKPTIDGPVSASLTVTDSAPNSPHSVPLAGTGTGGPQTGLSPASLDFGNQFVGVTTAAKVVTVTNLGDAPLGPFGLSSNGANSGDFNIQFDNCAGSLAPAASCTFDVVFKASLAAAESAVIMITDNAPGSPHPLQLSGTGLATPAGTYTITITGQSGANQHTTTVQLKVQ